MKPVIVYCFVIASLLPVGSYAAHSKGQGPVQADTMRPIPLQVRTGIILNMFSGARVNHIHFNEDNDHRLEFHFPLYPYFKSHPTDTISMTLLTNLVLDFLCDTARGYNQMNFILFDPNNESLSVSVDMKISAPSVQGVDVRALPERFTVKQKLGNFLRIQHKKGSYDLNGRQLTLHLTLARGLFEFERQGGKQGEKEIEVVVENLADLVFFYFLRQRESEFDRFFIHVNSGDGQYDKTYPFTVYPDYYKKDY